MGIVKTEWAMNPELRELADLGESEAVADILRGFLSDAEHQISKAEEAMRRGDGDGLGVAAHTLTGSAATVGLNDLSAVAQQLQALAKAHRLSESYEQLRSLRREFPLAKAAVNRTIEELDADGAESSRLSRL
jgi:HPt (histidine-containing phosphotransfer) domain-containing protein